jgi:carboxymethylenebutenolidase
MHGPPTAGLTRREFVVTSLAAGFAAAVTPVQAQTVITTDASGLVAGQVEIAVEGGRLPAYRAMPEAGASFPVVLVVQEIFGVHEHIRDVCRRFARLGYLAIAPELYARQGDASAMTDVQEIVTKVVARVPDAQVLSDLDATVAWAAASGTADATRLGITGFCWGGRIVWLYAAHSRALKAGVAWYGRLEGVADELHPKHPIDVVDDLKAPVLGLYGAADTGIPQESVEKMRTALKTVGSGSEIVLYPDAPHGFHADYRPTYRAVPATDGWQRTLKWLRSHGAA